MTPPILPLFTRSLKGWFSAKGFWLVVAAGLLPVILTGAWVTTHRADVALDSLSWNATTLTEGEAVRFTAVIKNVGPTTVGDFNGSIAVGSVSGGQLFPVGSNQSHIDSLAPGQTATVTFDWNATPGFYYVLATADPTSDPQDTTGKIPESDEFNNQNATPIVVGYQTPAPASAPPAPANLTGSANASTVADLSIDSLTVPESGDNRTLVAVVTNHGPNGVTGANVTLRIGQQFSGQFFPSQDTTTSLDLASGESKSVNLSWTTAPGAYWAEAFVAAPNGTTDPSGADNHATKSVVVNPTLDPNATPPKPPERLTIKQFYVETELLSLRIIIPLVALFYAAGVVADERERRALLYILVRPSPRWLFPIAKFVASFLVAAVAVIVGTSLGYALLFGFAPGGADVGFLTGTLLVSLLALFAYGALFTAIGILTDRPYLVGAGFVAWEFFDFPFVYPLNVLSSAVLAPWTRNFTIAFHVQNMLANWDLEHVRFSPDGDGTRALLVVVVAAIAFLVAAAYGMRRKEFEL